MRCGDRVCHVPPAGTGYRSVPIHVWCVDIIRGMRQQQGNRTAMKLIVNITIDGFVQRC